MWVLFFYTMKDKRFYNTQAWKDTREAYKRSVGGLCEQCLKHGLYVPGEIVHHKIHLDPDNVTDPSVALNFENLELVCRDCHGKLHRPDRRWKVDRSTGRVASI